MNDLISIIIPVYNVVQFINDCMNSVICQTYLNLEIILVDDGSTDGSSELCDLYAIKDKRIKVVHQKNMGLSCARNRGIELARGKYLFFLDSDDYIHPQLIRCLHDTLIKNKADIVFCAHQVVQEKEKIKFQPIDSVEHMVMEFVTGQECVERFYSHEAIDMVVVWNKLYKREHFEKLRFPAGKIHEDEFVNYKLLYPLAKCVYIKEKMYYYRSRNNSIMNCNFSLNYFDKVDAYCERTEYFRERNRKLYCYTLRRYLTSLAEGIIQLKVNFPQEKQRLEQLYEIFISKYKDAVKSGDITYRERMKFFIFLKNETLYIRWKRKADEYNRKIQQNQTQNEM